MYKKSKSILLIIVFLQSSFILNGQLMNGDFEEGSCGFPFYWTLDSWQIEGVEFLWEENTGISESRCISITNTGPNDSRWLQSVQLSPNTSYILKGWVKGENIVNHQAGFIYANISAMAEWNYRNSPSGTFDWKELSFCFTTDSSGKAQIGLRLGYFGNVVTGKAWFDNFTLYETDSLCGLKVNEGLHIKTFLEEDDLQVIT
jgi:hypothetical protein